VVRHARARTHMGTHVTQLDRSMLV
jgi:hypothetical protein